MRGVASLLDTQPAAATEDIVAPGALMPHEAPAQAHAAGTYADVQASDVQGGKVRKETPLFQEAILQDPI